MVHKVQDLFFSDPSLVFEVRQGIERESLRVDKNGLSAMTKHPESLGSKLTHKYITTDYSENLLEFITGVHSNHQSLLKELSGLHAYTYGHLNNEVLWPNSMPCILPLEKEIPIADFGESHIGRLKTLYRKGLGHRYGKTMQSIAGLHYNFSLSDTFWSELHNKEQSDLPFKEFKNQKYFHLIRNFQRYRWILMYFFGASNIVHESFVVDKKHNLEKLDDETFYNPHGISLRMGGLGYTSKAQEKISICFNQVDTYIKTLERARLESFPGYEKIGLKDGNELLQLNTNLLQIDNEFYSTIRPKNIAQSKESALKALYLRGVEYIEVRLLDINPFAPLGITAEQTSFLTIFLLWCLQSDSPRIDSSECKDIEFNFSQIVNNGLKKSLILRHNGKEIDRELWLHQLLVSMEPLVQKLAEVEPFYATAFDSIVRMGENKNILAQKLLDSFRGQSYIDGSLKQAEKFKKYYEITPEFLKDLDQCALASREQDIAMTSESFGPFESFLENYFNDIKISDGAS